MVLAHAFERIAVAPVDAGDRAPAQAARRHVEIAEAAGLDERYAREWLGAMTTRRIVEYDGARRTCYLPPEHAASLTRAAGVGQSRMLTQYIGFFGKVEGAVVEGFHIGEGVPTPRSRSFRPCRQRRARCCSTQSWSTP